MTTYPFPLPEGLRQRLPPLSRDGNHYLDVRVAGKWDGILVINGAGMCIGIYIRRGVEEYPLPFAPGEIEDIRRASLWNRFLGSLPFDIWSAALLTIFVFSPISLILGRFILPFALLSIAACATAICFMYRYGGQVIIRLPAALCGVGQIVWGFVLLLRWLRSALGG